MTTRFLSAIHESRHHPLVVSIASILALSAPGAAIATNRIVTSCDDSAPGSLRAVVGAMTTVSGDTVDLTGLTGASACPGSKISLTTGAIVINQNSLTILGPGAAELTVDASTLSCSPPCDNRVFSHLGTGTLTVESIGATGGYSKHYGIAALGGCIYSNGSVVLDHADVSSCSARTYSGNSALGGGVYAKDTASLHFSSVTGSSLGGGPASGGGVFSLGNVELDNSTVSGNTIGGNAASGGGVYSKSGLTLAHSTLSGNTITGASSAQGGGASAVGDFSAQYSTISDNHAYGPAIGGGVIAGGSVTVTASTISGNTSDQNIGGIVAYSASNYKTNVFTLTSSTISGNSALNVIGGAYADSATVNIYNSTIAFNTAANGMLTDFFAPGLALGAKTYTTAVTMHSSIISNNSYGQTGLDLSTAFNAITIGGANNLVGVPKADVPGDTLDHVCPLLGPLRDNGGLTMTHALLSTSPAIDAGNGDFVKDYDQRGSAVTNGVLDYLRISGKVADIGAYEVQQDDIVFNAGFDGCPYL